MAGSASPTPTLAEQVRRLAHGYVRHGAKANRRQQLGRFWKANRHLADSTAYAYWLALRELWRWLERTGEPPRPRLGDGGS